jgi:hypothetical protein
LAPVGTISEHKRDIAAHSSNLNAIHVNKKMQPEQTKNQAPTCPVAGEAQSTTNKVRSVNPNGESSADLERTTRITVGDCAAYSNFLKN